MVIWYSLSQYFLLFPIWILKLLFILQNVILHPAQCCPTNIVHIEGCENKYSEYNHVDYSIDYVQKRGLKSHYILTTLQSTNKSNSF